MFVTYLSYYSKGDGPATKYVPASEQTAPEPKKYTGSAIPSKSFRMLQAMTSPDTCGENSFHIHFKMKNK